MMHDDDAQPGFPSVLTVLGCDGGVAGGKSTSSFLLGERILIDAGTGLSRLGSDKLLAVDHVFLTHSHLDHVCALAFMADAVFGLREQPFAIHALPATLAALKAHLFNDVLWPDFSRLPRQGSPTLRYHELNPAYEFGALHLRPFQAVHSVPAVGYVIDSPAGRTLLSGDTTITDDYITAVAALGPLRWLVMECAFPAAMSGIAGLSGHVSPDGLAQLVQAIDHPGLQVVLTHLKPGCEREIMADVDGRLALGPRLHYAQPGMQLAL